MVANISRLDGTDQAWYADKPAWHGLGITTPGARTARQVVEVIPAFKKPIITVPIFARISGRYVEVPDKLGTVRRGETTVMGIVSPEYEKLTDEDAVKLLEAVITEAGKKAKAGFVTAGLLGHLGQRGFASIELTRVFGDMLKVKRDPSRQELYVFGDWTHDGSGALRIGCWNNRVECNNMLNAANAYADQHGLVARIRHAGDLKGQILEAQKTLGLVEVVGRTHAALMNALVDIPIKRPRVWLPGFTELVIETPPDAGDRAIKSRTEAREAIADLFWNSSNLAKVPVSAYRAYQAVAEYADHERPLRIGPDTPLGEAADRRFRSITEGPAADLKARALELIRQEFEVPVAPLARVLS